MQNKFIPVVFLSALAVAGNAYAETASESLTRIETETLLLKAREKQLDVQAKIIAKQSEIASRQAETDRIAQIAVVGHPVIRSVEGIGNAMYATLQLNNGNIVEVQPGDMLSNGMRVVSIRPNEVIAEDTKKQRIRLAGASQVPGAFNPSFPSPSVGLPPPLPMPMSRAQMARGGGGQ